MFVNMLFYKEDNILIENLYLLGLKDTLHKSSGKIFQLRVRTIEIFEGR